MVRGTFSPAPSSAISKGSTLKTVTLDVRPPADAMADFAQAWKTGKGSKSDRISFATPELLWKVLTAKRWELLKALCGAGPVTVREAARRVGRDVKAVHTDLSALLSICWRAEPHGVRPSRVPVRGGQGRVLAASGLRPAVGSNPRSGRAPTASRQARSVARYILQSPGLAPSRWCRLSSNAARRVHVGKKPSIDR